MKWLAFLLDFVRFLMRCFFFCRFRILKADLLGLYGKTVPSALSHMHPLGNESSVTHPHTVRHSLEELGAAVHGVDEVAVAKKRK